MAAMELGQTVSITAGKYAGQAVDPENVTVKSKDNGRLIYGALVL